MINIFEKVKPIEFLPNTKYLTTKMVADYYEVTQDVIRDNTRRHRQELEKNKIKNMEYSEIKLLFNNKKISRQSIKCYGINVASISNIFSIKAILKIAMLLTESDVAMKIRDELYNQDPVLYQELNGLDITRFKKHEQQYREYLEFSYGKKNIKKQVRCGSYYIDFVLFDNIAIEIDENGHCSYDKENEKTREELIVSKGYKIIRFNPHKELPYELIIKINNALNTH